jgi:hypothetical protein
MVRGMKPNIENTITLYTLSWSGYWDKYGKIWSGYINKLNTKPNEIIIVSDSNIDTSYLIHDNVKTIIVSPNKVSDSASYYRNIAIESSRCDWVVASDLDDFPMPGLLDNLDHSADIYAFSFFNEANKKIYYPDSECLNKRMNDIYDYSVIPGTSAIKKYIFNQIRYESNCHEDHILYKMLSKLSLKVSFDINNQKDYRFYYNHISKNNKDEIERITEIYNKVLHNNRNIYVFWFSKEMSDNRKNALEVLKKSCGVNLLLIDYDKFYEYEHKEIPIHKNFKDLTDVHKSDYARAYMMYFYGEGYSDIKANTFDWNKYFDSLFLSKFNAISYAETSPEDLASIWGTDENLKKHIQSQYYKFSGNCHYIFKPKTNFAYEWLKSIHKIMDEYSKELTNNPGFHPYAVKGGISAGYKGSIDSPLFNTNYPLLWTQICGDINHSLQYKNKFTDFVLEMPGPNINNYR